MVAPSCACSTCGDMPGAIYASVLRSVHRNVSDGVCVLRGHPESEESASRLMMTFLLSSIREVSLLTRHFETVVVAVLGDATPSRLLSESKHSSRLTLLASAAHLATSVFTSAFAQNADMAPSTKAAIKIR